MYMHMLTSREQYIECLLDKIIWELQKQKKGGRMYRFLERLCF